MISLHNKLADIMSRRPVYMVVTVDTNNVPVYLELDPWEDWFIAYKLRPELPTDNISTWTNKKQAEKALNFAKRYLHEALENQTVLKSRTLQPVTLNRWSLEMMSLIWVESRCDFVPKRDHRRKPRKDERYLDDEQRPDPDVF